MTYRPKDRQIEDITKRITGETLAGYQGMTKKARADIKRAVRAYFNRFADSKGYTAYSTLLGNLNDLNDVSDMRRIVGLPPQNG